MAGVVLGDDRLPLIHSATQDNGNNDGGNNSNNKEGVMVRAIAMAEERKPVRDTRTARAAAAAAVAQAFTLVQGGRQTRSIIVAGVIFTILPRYHLLPL